MCGGFVGDLVGDIADSIGDIGTDVWHNGGSDLVGGFLGVGLLGPVGNIVGLGYGDEAFYILSGEKYRDEKRLHGKAEQLNNLSSQIQAIQDRLGNKVFLEQIFKYGDIRRIRELGTTYEQLQKDYERLMADYKNNTDVGFIGDIVLFIPNVISSLVYNILDYIKTGDESSLRTAISIGLLIAVIVIAVLMTPWSAGSSLQIAAGALAILGALLSLDAMVNNSGLLGSVFRILDVVLNKVLNADEFMNTEGFDKDSHYYQKMMNNTRLAVTVASVTVNVYNFFTTSGQQTATTAAQRMAARNADFNNYMITGEYAGKTIISTAAGVSSQNPPQSSFVNDVKDIASHKIGGVASLSDLYEAYSMASNINDTYGAMMLSSQLKDRLAEEQDRIQRQIAKDNRRKFEASYADARYIMNQVDMSYHSYVLEMSEAGQTDVFDPEGTVVMNTRYSPKRSYQFGFEDIFQYEGMAGGQLYVYNTLWR